MRFLLAALTGFVVPGLGAAEEPARGSAAVGEAPAPGMAVDAAPAPDAPTPPAAESVEPEPGDATPQEPPGPGPLDWNRVVRFDPGRSDVERRYRSAEQCVETPCVLTKDGAIRFQIPELGRVALSLRLLNRGRITRVDYLEKRAKDDYFVVERMFNRARNKQVWSVIGRLEARELDTLHIYGVALQYKLEEGDLFVLEVADTAERTSARTYFFRYHKAGWRVRMDVALLVPINAVTWPKPRPPFKVSSLNAAASIALTKNPDPEADYLLVQKALLASSPTLFIGVMSRKLEQPARTQFDAFVGAGLTYFNFLFVAWGANVFQRPHSSNLFVGVHVGKAVRFIQDLDRTSPQKWDDYLEAERRKRTTNAGEPAPVPVL